MIRVRRRWKALTAVAACLAVFAALTVRLFVLPARGMPPRVDAIVMLNGSGDRFGTALGLAREHRAPYVVIARGSPRWARGGDCAAPIPRETIICFDPVPSTTRGEAEFAGRLARKYGWRSMVLVTSTPQDSRARLRVERCFPGSVYVVTAPLPARAWPYEIAYEWAATVKAVAVQRAC